MNDRMACGSWMPVVLAIVATLGCAPAGSRSLSGTPAEPEGRWSAAAAPPSRGPVPIVIAAPKPFHIAAVRPAPRRIQLPPQVTAGGAESVATPAAATDLHGIRQALVAYRQAFNRHDSTALAAHWTAAGQSIDLDSGEVTTGRDAVGAVFKALFTEDDDATIDIDVRSIRPVGADVAVVDGASRIRFGDGQSSASRFAAVLVRDQGRWLLESVSESAAPAANDHPPLADLAWLVGSWEDVGEGLTASTCCFWSTGRGFLVRTHVVTADRAPEEKPRPGDDRIPALLPAADVDRRELTEIIGWDPERRQIRSWLFSSQGRFAEATWTGEGDTWLVRTEGRGADEGQVGECTLVRDGADGLSVRSTGTGLLSLLPPACDFVRTGR